jgi:hypothetical protein
VAAPLSSDSQELAHLELGSTRHPKTTFLPDNLIIQPHFMDTTSSSIETTQLPFHNNSQDLASPDLGPSHNQNITSLPAGLVTRLPIMKTTLTPKAWLIALP